MTKKRPPGFRFTLRDLFASSKRIWSEEDEEGLARARTYVKTLEEEYDRMDREAEAAAYREMIPLIPASVADPESLAAEAYATFDRSFFASRAKQGKGTEADLRPFMGTLASALRHLNTALASLSIDERHVMQEEVSERGIELDVLFEQLHVLGEIAQNVASARALGRVKDHATVASLDAAQYLMEHGIKRQRAAKLVAVVMAHQPDVAAKDWRTIQAALVDAGISARTKKLVKGGQEGYISLTPG